MTRTGSLSREFAQITHVRLPRPWSNAGAVRDSRAEAEQLIGFIDRAVEQHIVIGHVEMAVIVDPLRLDLHHRGDEGRVHRSAPYRIDGFLAGEHARDVGRAFALQFLERLDRIKCRVRRDDDVVAAEQRGILGQRLDGHHVERRRRRAGHCRARRSAPASSISGPRAVFTR